MHWYAAIVARQKERLFSEYLAASGFEGYIPREARWVRVGRRPSRQEERLVPVIRGLVFIGAAANLARDAYAWQQVAALPFYKALVGMGDEPRTISQTEIDRMMDARAGKQDLHVGYQSKVRPGEHAKLTNGSFAGVKVLKVRELVGRRAVVMAQLLGGEREIEVDDVELEPWVA